MRDLVELTEILAGCDPPDLPSPKISRFDAQASRPYSLDLVIAVPRAKLPIPIARAAVWRSSNPNLHEGVRGS